MNENAKRNLRNVIVFALVDGKLTEEEKQFVESLRVKLGIDEEEFRELCDQVRKDRKRMSLPRARSEAEEAVRLLVQTATADGEVSDSERRLLHRVAEYVELPSGWVDQWIDSKGEEGIDDTELRKQVDDIYANFTQWDEPTRRERIGGLAALGPPVVITLLRMLESYRAPDGAPDAMELKTLLTEQLGRIADSRAAYYLAQQVNIGDSDDEITNAALRHAAAEALGRIVGAPFTRDREGVLAAREWWISEGRVKYDSVAF